MINKIITELYKKNIPYKGIHNKLKRKLPYEEDVEDYSTQRGNVSNTIGDTRR